MDVRVEKLEEIIERWATHHADRQTPEHVEMMEKVQAMEREIHEVSAERRST